MRQCLILSAPYSESRTVRLASAWPRTSVKTLSGCRGPAGFGLAVGGGEHEVGQIVLGALARLRSREEWSMASAEPKAERKMIRFPFQYAFACQPCPSNDAGPQNRPTAYSSHPSILRLAAPHPPPPNTTPPHPTGPTPPFPAAPGHPTSFPPRPTPPTQSRPPSRPYEAAAPTPGRGRPLAEKWRMKAGAALAGRGGSARLVSAGEAWCWRAREREGDKRPRPRQRLAERQRAALKNWTGGQRPPLWRLLPVLTHGASQPDRLLTETRLSSASSGD